ncbi:MAG: hypothetical protein NT007_03740 [Candidatus Kapabacteria bacterium]|nr:hypothetical protein [Candidatus Kapabacteria bacterium]
MELFFSSFPSGFQSRGKEEIPPAPLFQRGMKKWDLFSHPKKGVRGIFQKEIAEWKKEEVKMRDENSYHFAFCILYCAFNE